jgi:hypothetical protein
MCAAPLAESRLPCCRHHPQEAVPASCSAGLACGLAHPCCGAPVLASGLRSSGCSSRDHVVLVPPAALMAGLSQVSGGGGGGGGCTPRRRLVASTTGLTTGSNSSSQAPALLGSTSKRAPEAPQAAAPGEPVQQQHGAAGAKPAAVPGLRGCSSQQEVVAACQLLRSYSHLIALPQLQPARTLAPPAQRPDSGPGAQRACASGSASGVTEGPADAGPSSPAAAPAGAPAGSKEQREPGQEAAQPQLPKPWLVSLLGSSAHAASVAATSSGGSATGAPTEDARAPAGADAQLPGPSGSKASVQGPGIHVQAVALMYQYRAGNVGGLQLHARAQRAPGSSAFPSPRGFGSAGRAGAGVSVLAQVMHHVKQHDALQMAQLRERLLAARRLPAPPPPPATL